MNTPVVDLHSHVGSWAHIESNVERYLRIMDAAGVDLACVSCLFHGEAARNNDVVAAFVARHPDRFAGVAFVTPHYPEEVIGELDRAFDVLGLRSLKVYPTYYGKPIDDPGYFPIFEWCNERGVTMMSHSSFWTE